MNRPGAELWLAGHRVGRLDRNAEGRVCFSPDEGWLSHPEAPVLGQHLLDRGRSPSFGAAVGRLPPFFANLLPQGPYRHLLEEQHQPADELELLCAVGADLPGALIVTSVDAEPVRRPAPPEELLSQGELRITASLAGMQAKLSMSRTEKVYTLPAQGVDGDWIVKLPGRIPRVPEVEHATFVWARASGLVVPEVELVELGRVQRGPLRYGPGDCAFAIRRYDRPPGGRIHQEDFAQVLNLPPERVVGPLLKGADRSHGTQLRIIAALCPEDIEQWLRWLIFLILSGNNDAHHKNLALWYPDPRRARLAPFYDLVAQVVWREHWVQPEAPFGLELHVDRVRSFAELDMTQLLALCRKSGVEIVEARLWPWVEQAREAWTQLRAQLALEAAERSAIDTHLDGLPLLRGLSRRRAGRA
jgi:serine/threonine-protein kinase HipA